MVYTGESTKHDGVRGGEEVDVWRREGRREGESRKGKQKTRDQNTKKPKHETYNVVISEFSTPIDIQLRVWSQDQVPKRAGHAGFVSMKPWGCWDVNK